MVSRAAWLYIVLVVAVTGVLVAVTPYDATPRTIRHAVTRPGRPPGPVPGLRLRQDAADVSRQTKWSPSSAATLAAVVLLGPLAAALVGAASLLSLRRQLLLAERLFNGAMHALCGLAAGQAYVALEGQVGPPQPTDFQADRHRVRRGRGRARAGQPHAHLGRLPAESRQRHAAPRGPGVQPAAAAGLRPRLRVPRPGHRRAVADHGLVLGGARAGPAVRGPLGDGAVRRAAARLRGDHERALPGGGDQGLLHPRPRRPGVPRRGHDRPPDRDELRPDRGDQVRRHAARRRQARRADPGAAEDRAR